MNAIELLQSQHQEIDSLLKAIEHATTRGAKHEAFVALADRVAAHAHIEEELFYPAIVAKRTEDDLLESLEEHLSIKRILADLVALDCSDAHFDAKLSVMKEALEHHNHEEEEGELFPKAASLLGKDELDGLGGEMAARFVALIETKPRLAVRSETKGAAPVPGLT